MIRCRKLFGKSPVWLGFLVVCVCDCSGELYGERSLERLDSEWNYLFFKEYIGEDLDFKKRAKLELNYLLVIANQKRE